MNETQIDKTLSESPQVGTKVPRPYLVAETYERGDRILHKKYGLGMVEKVLGDQIEVTFESSTKMLTHGMVY